jgi:hypothetical protein
VDQFLGSRSQDDGDDRMNNTNENENPIMTELGYPARTKYSPVNPIDKKYRAPGFRWPTIKNPINRPIWPREVIA